MRKNKSVDINYTDLRPVTNPQKHRHADSDWFDELNKEQQNDVLEGLAEADRGEPIPHAQVVKLFGKWGLK